MATWEALLEDGEKVVASFDNPMIEARETGNEKFARSLGSAGSRMSAGVQARAAKDRWGANTQRGRQEVQRIQQNQAKTVANVSRVKQAVSKLGGKGDKLLITNKRILGLSGEGVIFEVITDPEYMKKTFDQKLKKLQTVIDEYREDAAKDKAKGFLSSIFQSKETKTQLGAVMAEIHDDVIYALSNAKREKPLIGKEELILETKQWYLPYNFNPNAAALGGLKPRSIPRPWAVKFDGDAGTVDSIVSILEPRLKGIKDVQL